MAAEPKTRVLLVDDEEQIRAALGPVLKGSGYEVVEAADGNEAMDLALSIAPDIVVLDVMMPGLSGIEVCERIRRGSKVPILMLTVRDEPADKIAALDAGADDYLTKPFDVGELLARMRALLRRSSNQLDSPVKVGDLEIDIARRRVTVRGEEVELRRREFDILATLAAEQGRVVTSTALAHRVLGKEIDGKSDVVPLLRVHVSNLRRRIEPQPSVPRYVITEPGVGFRLAED